MNTYFLSHIEPERRKKIRKNKEVNGNFVLFYSKGIKLEMNFDTLFFEILGCDYKLGHSTFSDSFYWFVKGDQHLYQKMSFKGKNWYNRLNVNVVRNMMYLEY